MDAASPDHIGPWALQAVIGIGAMGEVWRVRHLGTGQQAALKRPRPDRPPADAHPHLAAEVAALARLDHPHIPALLGHDLHTPTPHLVMTLAAGEALNVLIASGALWQHPLTARLDALTALASAIDHLHARGIVHADIKPANIRGLDHPMLLDFGLARPFSTDSPPPDARAGTPAYQPPPSEPLTPASDRYAFAVTAYELLLGAHPILHHTDQHHPPDALRRLAADRVAQGRWRTPDSLPPATLPPDLRAADRAGLTPLFHAALAADPAARPARLTDWTDAVRACALASLALPDADRAAPFVPPPPLPDYTRQQAADAHPTRPPVGLSGWWAQLRARLRRPS
jgi:serine/threonine protein kinase